MLTTVLGYQYTPVENKGVAYYILFVILLYIADKFYTFV